MIAVHRDETVTVIAVLRNCNHDEYGDFSLLRKEFQVLSADR